jgi:hypothetical protein
LLSQAGAKLGTVSHLGAKVAGGPATVWTAHPRRGGRCHPWVRQRGRLGSGRTAPDVHRVRQATGEAIAARRPTLKSSSRLTEQGRNVVSMIRTGRMESGQATREAHRAYERSSEGSMPSKAEAKTLLEDQGVKPKRSEVREARRQEAIINQQAGSMIRDQTAVPLTTLPGDHAHGRGRLIRLVVRRGRAVA